MPANNDVLAAREMITNIFNELFIPYLVSSRPGFKAKCVLFLEKLKFVNIITVNRGKQ